jgi:hypothetical protein
MSTSPRHANRAAIYRFWRRWLGPAVLAAAVSAAGGAHAEDSVLTWIVKSISYNEDGDIIQASTMQVPREGTALVTGQRISTGAGQTMVLVNGRDLVEIGASSAVSIGDNDASTPKANVNLINGTIHVEVGKRAPGTTFSIDAPYLVATVKGTQFNVISSIEQTSVSVTEGVVAVSADASGANVDVTIGNTAVVRRNADKPMLAPTPASSAPNTIEVNKDLESASTDDGSSGGGSNSDGSNSGGSNSGGSNSGSGGSNSGSGGIGGAVGDATGAVGGAVGGATGAVGDAVGGVTGAVGDAVGGPVGDAVSGVGGAVGGAVSGVGGAVGGAVGGLGGAVGGLLGGDR